MSYQATEAFRDRSKSKGAVRTVGFVMSTYADKYGDGIHPAISTLAEQAKVSRSTAITARQWFIESGEAIVTGSKPSRTKSPIPELSFSPLLKGPEVGPLESKGPETAPLGSGETTLKGPESEQKGPEIGPEPEGNHPTKPEGEAAAAAASSSDEELDQLVDRIYRMWKAECFPDANKPLTDPRRRVIVERLGHYEPDEVEEAIRNRENSDWFSGRKPSDHKQRYDLTDLLASDETLEELREARPPQSDRLDFISRMNARRGLREPALEAICSRPVDEESEEERRARYAKYDEKVEAAYVEPAPTPAQLRAEHAELLDDVEALKDQYARNESPATLKGLEQRRSEVADLEAAHPDVFGSGVAA